MALNTSFIQRGPTSPTKIAALRPNGIARSIAPRVTTVVPTIIGSIPKNSSTSLSGRQRLVNRSPSFVGVNVSPYLTIVPCPSGTRRFF